MENIGENGKNKIPPGCTGSLVNGCVPIKGVSLWISSYSRYPKPSQMIGEVSLKQPENWVQRKHSKIFSLHFTPGDVIRRKLRPEALPLPSFPSQRCLSPQVRLKWNTELLRIIIIYESPQNQYIFPKWQNEIFCMYHWNEIRGVER